MTPSYNFCLERWDFGDKRLTKRAIFIGEALSVKYGQPLSQVFKNASDLKRTYEFLTNPKTTFAKVIQPHHVQTAHQVSELPIVLAVGDTTYLDYKKIIAKREEYGPIGKGGNGLILHSTLALAPDNGQPLGLLWEKLWHREHHKKKNKTRSIQEKESYRWVEALSEVQKLLSENQEPKLTESESNSCI